MEESEASYQVNGSNTGSPIKPPTSFPEGVGIDVLFDRQKGKSRWSPTKAPQVLGELLDSRFMLDLELPSDPRMLAAVPGPMRFDDYDKGRPVSLPSSSGLDKVKEKVDTEIVLGWRNRARALRDVSPEALQWVDGVTNQRWPHPTHLGHRQDIEREPSHDIHHTSLELEQADLDEPGYGPSLLTLEIPHTMEDAGSRISPLARRPSGRGRQRLGSNATPIEEL